MTPEQVLEKQKKNLALLETGQEIPGLENIGDTQRVRIARSLAEDIRKAQVSQRPIPRP